MKQRITCNIIWIALFISCSNNKNPYENDLGIEPSLIAQMDTANYTKILWEDTLIDFGNINAKDTARVQFRFKNTGNKVLFILSVTPSCGCTVADFPKEPIQPGKEGIIKAKYKWNGQTGAIRKAITVRTNTKNNAYHRLILIGEVDKEF